MCGLAVVLSVCVCCDPDRGGARAVIPRQGDDKLDKLINELGSKDENTRIAAVTALQDLGPKAAAAAPALAVALADKNEDVRFNAALALGKIGKAAVPALAAPPGQRRRGRALLRPVSGRLDRAGGEGRGAEGDPVAEPQE